MNCKLQRTILVFILGFIQIFTFSYANEESDLASGLDVTLSMPEGEYYSSDVLMLNFTLTNTTKEPITFLKWETPLENDFRGNMFTIRLDGQDVQYIGKIVKRAAPKKNDFVTLAAGESISGMLDLADGYAIKGRGDYTLAFNKHLQIANDYAAKSTSNVTLKPAALHSPTIRFALNEGRYAKQQAKQANFSSCSASKTSTLNDAHAAAIVLAEESLASLNNAPADERSTAERYVTWFGDHTDARYNTVTTHFSKIQDALANKQVKFHCDCTDNFFAYVHTNDEYNIHICNLFWQASLNGTDSQAGTLIHEVSHFIVVATTDDHQYGANPTKELAKTDPDKAIDNADNHEYFAENNPKLSMKGNSSGGDGDGGGGLFHQEILYLLLLLGMIKLGRKYGFK